MSQNTDKLLELGHRSRKHGDYHRALGWYEQALAQAHRDGQSRQELGALHDIGIVLHNSGDFQGELEVSTNLLARARQLQDEYYQMLAAYDMCLALAQIDLRNRWCEIRPLLLEGLATARRLGDSFWEIAHLKQLGFCAVRAGEGEQGYVWLQEALNAIGSQTRDAAFLREEIYRFGLAYLMRQRGEHAEAVRYAEMAVGEAEECGNLDMIARAHLELAWTEYSLGELGTAMEIVEGVLVQARECGWEVNECRGEKLRAEIERVLGHPDVAVAAARRALELALEMRLKQEEVECLLNLGQALWALGEREEAVDILRRARRLSQERDYEDYFNKAEELLAGLPERREA